MKKIAFLLAVMIAVFGITSAVIAESGSDAAPSLCTHGSNFVKPVLRPGDSITVDVEILETVTAGKGAGYVFFDALEAPLTCKRIKVTNETENSQVVAPPKALDGKFAVIGCMDFEQMTVLVKPGVIATMTFEVNEAAAPGVYSIDVWGGEDILQVSGSMSFSILSDAQEPIPAVPATCSQNGLTDGVKCAFCGEILLAQQETPRLPHTEEEIPGEPATCTQTGLTDGVECAVCGEILVAQQETPLLPHTEKKIPGVPATCVQTGLSDGLKCAVCGEILLERQETPILTHTEKVITPALYLGDSITVVVAIQETLPAGEGGYVCFDASQAPLTCKSIKVTNQTENAQVVAPPKALKGRFAVIGCMDAEQMTVEIKPGVIGEITFEINEDAVPGIYTISVWGEGDILQASGGMSFSVLSGEQMRSSAVPATCLKTGLTEGVKCVLCGEILVAQQKTERLPHTEEAIPAVPATCSQNGLTEGVKCTVCGKILVAQQKTELLPHTEEAIPAVPATCLKTGLTEGVKCADCGKSLTAQEVVPALGHTEGDREIAVEPTATTAGEARYSCVTCGEILRTEEIPALGLPGDANDDGLVDVFDALAVLKHTVEWTVAINERLADVTGDAVVDVFDALRILQYCVEWNVTLE